VIVAEQRIAGLDDCGDAPRGHAITRHRALEDRIAEPARAPLLPGFLDAKHAALAAGAVGGSISGAGPTSFALCADAAIGARVGEAMRLAYEQAGIAATVRVATPDLTGAVTEILA